MKLTGIEDKKYWDDFFKKTDWDPERLFKLTQRWNKREKHISIRGFVFLTKETLVTLTDILTGRDVLDLGAGTGYMLYHLRKNNINIDGVVKSKKDYDFKRNFMTKRLIVDDYTTMDISKYNTFILSWPDYEGEDAAKFLQRMKSGDKLVYEGEGQCGCCADDEFFEVLDSDFIELDEETSALNQHHVKFYGIHDNWSVYIKR